PYRARRSPSSDISISSRSNTVKPRKSEICQQRQVCSTWTLTVLVHSAPEIPCIFPAAAGREFHSKPMNPITESGSAAQLRGESRKIPCKFPAGREFFAKTEPADGPVRDPSRRCRQHGLSRKSLHGRWGCKARENRPKVRCFSVQYQ